MILHRSLSYVFPANTTDARKCISSYTKEEVKKEIKKFASRKIVFPVVSKEAIMYCHNLLNLSASEQEFMYKDYILKLLTSIIGCVEFNRKKKVNLSLKLKLTNM
jgi:hypothetical protein